MSAVITSEYATQRTRGMMIAAVFAMQGIGQLSAAIVAIIVIRCFKGAIMDDHMNVDYVWRICLGLGMNTSNNIVPPSLYFFHFRMCPGGIRSLFSYENP